MDDFSKMLEIVKRVEDRFEPLEEKVSGLYAEIKTVNKWRWRIEGSLFLASGVISAVVAFLLEMIKR
jgi:hypothetical protein